MTSTKVNFYQHSDITSNILAGLTSGIVTLVYSISFAALIFSGSLSQFFPQGAGIALIGATITAIIVALRSSLPFTLAGPEGNSAIILALMAGTIASSLNTPETESYLYPTVWAAIILSSLITGVSLYILGKFHLGQWARFIPYPVIGGFLAGTGWLITRNSFNVMAGVPLEFTELHRLIQGDTLCHWLTGIVFALILFFTLNRHKQFWVLPSLLLSGIAGFNSIWWIVNNYWFKVDAEGWFFKPFSGSDLWKAWDYSTLTRIDWYVLLHQCSTLIAMAVIVMITILLNSTGLEIAISRTIDLNRELRANGIANLVNGFCGGMVGYLSINRCLINQHAGANSPLAGIVAGSLCGSMLLFGSAFLSYIPKAILGGLLLYIGLNLLLHWIYKSWFQFPRRDCFLIMMILVAIAGWGFLQGVIAGIIVACILFILSYGHTSSVKYTSSARTFRSKVERSSHQKLLLQEEGDSIFILVLHGFIFFGTANDLLEKVHQRIANPKLPTPHFIVFDFRLVIGLDSTAVLSFMKLAQLANKSGFGLVFTKLETNFEWQVKQEKLFDEVSRFPDLDQGIEWCENKLMETNQVAHSAMIPLQDQLQSFLLDDQLVPALMKYFQLLIIPEGDFLFRQGDPSDGLYFLESGQVTVVLELSNGQSIRRRTYIMGTVMGEMGLYTKAPRSASVVAEQLSHLHHFSSKSFEKMTIENPQLAVSFHSSIVNLLAERLKSSEEEIKNLLQ